MRSFPTSVLVREFHEVFECAVSDTPTKGDPALRELRVRLIAEELKEFADACGVYFEYGVGSNRYNKPNLLGMADALIDLDYVVSGSMVSFGLNQWDGVCEVHRSNMSKAGADGKPIRNELGKVLKGPNYVPPNLVYALGLPPEDGLSGD